MVINNFPVTNQPLKEYESHGSILPEVFQYPKSLEEVFREAARDGSLYE